MIEDRRFLRKVEPIDAEVSVDLFNVITPGRGLASWSEIVPLIVWIEDGLVDLRVIALRKFFDDSVHDAFLSLGAILSGKAQHQSLCALACAYLHSQGKSPLIGGNSACSYAGGWADVIAEDGSLYIECGTLNSSKPFDAMCYGQTLMVIPYTLGCDLPDARTIDLLKSRTDPSNTYAEIGSIDLGYIFKPKHQMRKDPFSPLIGIEKMNRMIIEERDA